MRKDRLLITAIYLLALWFNFTRFHWAVEPYNEYYIYWQNIMADNGEWMFRAGNLLNSCLFTTYFPALIQRAFHTDPELTFVLFPCVLYSFMPVFVYLIARTRLTAMESLVAVLCTLATYHFLYSQGINRVGVALAFSSVMVWAVIRKDWVVAGIAMGLVVFSHYTTSFIMLGMLAVVALANIISKRSMREVTATVIALSVLGIGVVVWHGMVCKYPIEVAMRFIGKAAASVSWQSIVDLTNRESMLKSAFGLTFSRMGVWTRTEFILSWVMVGLIAVGFVYAVRKRAVVYNHAVIACYMMFIIALTIIVPHISVGYGVVRVYSTALIALAPCYPIGAKVVFGKLGLPAEAIAAAVSVAFIILILTH